MRFSSRSVRFDRGVYSGEDGKRGVYFIFVRRGAYFGEAGMGVYLGSRQ